MIIQNMQLKVVSAGVIIPECLGNLSKLLDKTNMPATRILLADCSYAKKKDKYAEVVHR